MKKLSAALQESLVALLCYDAGQAKAVAALLPWKTYDPFFRDLVREAQQYLAQYGKPPGEHTYDLVEALKEQRPDDEKVWDRIYYSLNRTKDLINKEYTLSRASVFARRQAAKVVIQKAMPLLLKDDDSAVDQAEALLAGVGKEHLTEFSQPGTLLNDPSQALRFLDTMDEESMPLGIKELDRFGLGPIRKGLWLGVAPTNAGKTWLAVQKGKMGLITGKRVLHVTLEMSESKVAMRYCQSLFAVSKRREQAELIARRFRLDELGRFIGLDEHVLKNRPALTDPDIRQFLTKRIKPLSRRPRLIIKEFPTGKLTLPKLEAYLDRLEATMRFIPDLVLVDYPDLMEYDSRHTRPELDRLFKGLRGIAGERNMAVAAYSQSSKEGMAMKVMGRGKANESFAKEHTADIVITYNQTDAEYKLGLARLYVAKAREDVRNFQVLISQMYGVGQFAVDSCRMIDSTYWPMVDRTEEDGDD